MYTFTYLHFSNPKADSFSDGKRKQSLINTKDVKFTLTLLIHDRIKRRHDCRHLPSTHKVRNSYSQLSITNCHVE